jgi:dTDP-glucose 4,6-dehydratase
MIKKNIVVTGGLGFIGSNLIRLLLRQNYFVINIDKVSYSSNFYNTAEYKKNINYKFYRCDINNQRKINQIFNKHRPICVFNLAAETHVDRSIDNPNNFIKSNIVSFYNFIELFRKYSKKYPKSKLIHISTDEVYGDILKGRSKESDPYKPSSPYAATKAASDHLLAAYIRTYRIPAIITNCSNNYGPRQHPEKLIPKVIFNIFNNKKIPLYADGKNSREWIYVEDHCEALIKIFKRGKLGEFYNIGSNQNLTNIQIIKSIIKVARKYIDIGNNVEIEYVKDRPGHDFRYAINSNKLRNNLKWKPKIGTISGIEKTFLWYFKNLSYFDGFSQKDINSRLGLNK